MNKTTALLAILAGGILTLPAMADDSVTPPIVGVSSDFTVKKKYTPSPPPPVNPGRPKMPPMVQYLHGSYVDGVLSIDFPEDTESATVTLSTGSFPVFSAGIDRGYPCVELPALTGDYILNVTFDNGDEYEGEVYF